MHRQEWTQVAVTQSLNIREGQENKKHGKHQRHERKKNGFTQKLKSELITLGADGFSYADFFGSFCGTGSGKIHEVDTGDGHHDQRDNQENIRIVLIKFLIVDVV